MNGARKEEWGTKDEEENEWCHGARICHERRNGALTTKRRMNGDMGHEWGTKDGTGH